MLNTYTNLRIYRRREDLTQEELGALVGTGKASISAIERGATKAGAVVEKLAELFNVSEKNLTSNNPKLVLSKQDVDAKKNMLEGVRLIAPEGGKAKPMFAARPMETKNESVVTQTDSAPQHLGVKEASSEHQRTAFDGIVQVLQCTAGAANKYLNAGWILLNTKPKSDGDEFVLLLGSTKPYSNEDFERLKAGEKTTPHYSPKGWKGC